MKSPSIIAAAVLAPLATGAYASAVAPEVHAHTVPVHQQVGPQFTLDHKVTEDDPQWNCLTMGNRQCGPAWSPAPAHLVPGHRHCWWRVGPTSYFACPDGYVTTS